MPIAFRGRRRIGPFIANIGLNGVTSLALKIGPLTYNLTRRQTSVDLPGWFSWRSRPRGPHRTGTAFTWAQLARVTVGLLVALGIPATAIIATLLGWLR